MGGGDYKEGRKLLKPSMLWCVLLIDMKTGTAGEGMAKQWGRRAYGQEKGQESKGKSQSYVNM